MSLSLFPNLEVITYQRFQLRDPWRMSISRIKTRDHILATRKAISERHKAHSKLQWTRLNDRKQPKLSPLKPRCSHASILTLVVLGINERKEVSGTIITPTREACIQNKCSHQHHIKSKTCTRDEAKRPMDASLGHPATRITRMNKCTAAIEWHDSF